jgi:hypothetical protein
MRSAKPNPVRRWFQPYCLLAVACVITGCLLRSIDFVLCGVVFAAADGAIPLPLISKAISRRFGGKD